MGASMEIRSAVLGTADDADDQAGRGKSDEEHKQRVAGPAEEEVVKLTTCSAKAEGRSCVRTESLCLMRTNTPSVPVAH